MNIQRILPVSLLLSIMMTLNIPAQQSTAPFSLTAKEARTVLANDSSVILLDVRTQDEFNSERISNTPLIPVQSLESRMHELNKYKKNKIIVYCRSGNRSGVAVKMLREHGFSAINMRGGITQWKTEQFPVISGSIQ